MSEEDEIDMASDRVMGRTPADLEKRIERLEADFAIFDSGVVGLRERVRKLERLLADLPDRMKNLEDTVRREW